MVKDPTDINLPSREVDPSGFLDDLLEMVIYLDLNLKVKWCNKAAASTLGKAPKDLIGRHCYELWHQRNLPCENCPLQRALITRKMEQNEMETPDGRFWFLRGSPMFDTHGEISGLLEFAHEITEQKQMEMELLESELRFRQLAEHSTEGFWIKSKGNILYINSALSDIFETPENQLYQVPDILKYKIHPVDEEMIFSVLASEQYKRTLIFEGEYRISLAGNRVKWLWIRQFPIFDKKGEIYREAGIVSDITQRKLAQEKLSCSEKHLRDLNGIKDRFFSVVAHDLRNPINAILNFTGYILKNYDNFGSFELKQVLQDLHLMTSQGSSLLDNLLHWSRAQMTEFEARSIPVNLVSLVQECINACCYQASQKKVQIHLTSSENILVQADPDMVSMVVRNLLSNAIKYSHREKMVNIYINELENEIITTVADEGTGIPKNDLSKLFQLSSRYSTSGTENEKGTGLGLVLCKEFIEKMKGRIWVESEWGKGSQFSFSLPLSSGHETQYKSSKTLSLHSSN